MSIRFIGNFLRKLTRSSMDPPAQPANRNSPCPHVFPVWVEGKGSEEEKPSGMVSKSLTNEAADHFGNIYVYSATYCKMKRTAEHEFVLLKVRDKTDPTRSTVLVVHRVPLKERDTPPTPADVTNEGTVPLDADGKPLDEAKTVTETTEPQYMRFSSTRKPEGKELSSTFVVIGPALDVFAVPVSSGLEGVCSTQNLKPYEPIEELEINHQDLGIEKVFVLAATVTSHCPTYNLYRTQCYWYASVIWDNLVTLAKDGDHEKDVVYRVVTPKRGTKTLLRFLTLKLDIDDKDKHEALRVKYEKAWVKFSADVEAHRGRGNASLTIRVAAEAEGRVAAESRATAAEENQQRAEAQAEVHRKEAEVHRNEAEVHRNEAEAQAEGRRKEAEARAAAEARAEAAEAQAAEDKARAQAEIEALRRQLQASQAQAATQPSEAN